MVSEHFSLLWSVHALTLGLQVVSPPPELLPGTGGSGGTPGGEVGGELGAHQQLPLRSQVVHCSPAPGSAPLKLTVLRSLSPQHHLLLLHLQTRLLQWLRELAAAVDVGALVHDDSSSEKLNSYRSEDNHRIRSTTRYWIRYWSLLLSCQSVIMIYAKCKIFSDCMFVLLWIMVIFGIVHTLHI